ncbi:hypothetical protein AB0952_08990 [Streptomyces caniferus]|uniref:hypothetical protein n=1 Tax=Streptomyces caniferus TaxID=285557 RepID=UPI0034511200
MDALEVYCRSCRRPYEDVADQDCEVVLDNRHLIGGVIQRRGIGARVWRLPPGLIVTVQGENDGEPECAYWMNVAEFQGSRTSTQLAMGQPRDAEAAVLEARSTGKVAYFDTWDWETE